MEASASSSKGQMMDAGQDSGEEELRRSSRLRSTTEKMLAYQREEAHRKEKRLIHLYEQWKIQARKARELLKVDIPENQIATLIDTLEKANNDVMDLYMEIRDYIAPSDETEEKLFHVDACEAVTKDMVKIAYERIAGIDGEFDGETVKQHLRELLNRDYARSIYGSTVSLSSQNSIASMVAVKVADAAAELAARKVEYEMLLEEEKQCERIQQLEEQQKRDLAAQKNGLARLKAEKDIRAAQAKLNIYNQGGMQEADVARADYDIQKPLGSAPIHQSFHGPVTPSRSQSDASHLAQVVQDSIALNRLPMPEPSMFTGDPIQFIEWKASFISLIDRKNISSADKLYYLKRYVGGPARKTLDGIFYRNDDKAYNDAWVRLNHRYGQPFIVAFRERLPNWQKIQSRDAEGLRTFADFLHACQEDMPHVKGLEILNDCEENQKLVLKLPEWAASGP
ncbi:uncharacterized protein LOC114789067 [Denticeps clupeoides]|uniref:uncharacterized protein LOC114789067 n=1 Tax=Denticeps clupeoides TaxID=299321 RepID=UPI0010A46AF8|nr:uncharacterized protein LOC114789067 [Denticeps clupeoides]XP_028833972.1 uncharacterized protein LOC114789067 [Denticeps clupeoides]